MTLELLKKEEREEIERKLYEQFGIKEIPGILLKRGKERIFLFKGNLDKKEIESLQNQVFIERAGVYFAKKINGEEKYRLSIEGTQLLKEQITKNIYELDEEKATQWMAGKDLDIKTEKRDVLVMKYEDNFMGCGKASEEKIGNFIPKNRRLKTDVL